MLFNSYLYLFIFLPVTLFVFFRIGNFGHHRVASIWLVGASLFFYSWWNPSYLGLILASILFNYAIGIAVSRKTAGSSDRQRRHLLFIGVLLNLLTLGFYKYTGLLVGTANTLFDLQTPIPSIALPLAISFFTFQQIAFLVDSYRGETREINFLHYTLFVCFFPQLIAGPIVHHKEILPQFRRRSTYLFSHRNLAIGATIFTIGLFKKTVIADGISVYSTPVFDAASQDATLTFFEAWGGALAYTFQIYFDFSGYSDMAIGSARMFGIKLPANFNSPYKSRNIIEFWRRWHMTLSRFLRDYLYFPLGGSRCGKLRRYVNLLITMLLGGLWHGAAWTFVAWGFMHGTLLIINHAWIRLCQKAQLPRLPEKLQRGTGRALTLFAVINSWVLFRATDFESALNVYKGMYGLNGLTLSREFFGAMPSLHPLISSLGLSMGKLPYFHGLIEIAALTALLLITLLLPNTQQLMRNYSPVYKSRESTNNDMGLSITWKPSAAWALILFLMFAASVGQMTNISEFLYFNF